MTSASLALTANEHKLLTLLKLIFSDEMADQPQDATDLNAKFCMHKLMSLSNHRKVLEQPAKADELKAKSLGGQTLPGIAQDQSTGKYVLGTEQPIHIPKEMFDLQMERPKITEEFNKKVFTLIEMAQDEQRLSQRQTNWAAWF